MTVQFNRVLFFLLSFLPLSSVYGAGAEETRFSANPMSTQAGQEVTLTWQTSSQRAYLSGIGAVEPSGTLVVTPRETVSYSLVTEQPAGMKSVTVTVSGNKGESEFPADLERFRFPLSCKRNIPSLVGFLNMIHHLLQDEMKFSLRESTTSSEQFLFLTHSAERAELLQKTDDRIAARRISYLVQIEKRQLIDNEINVSIKALIEYRRKREAAWRIENDVALYQITEAKLRERIELLR